MNTFPTVTIFTNRLLNYSETFIRAQGEALKHFSSNYLGSYIVPDGLQLPQNKQNIIRDGFRGKIADVLLKLGWLSPRIRRIGINLSPQLIHAHFGPSGLNVLPLAKALNVPLITTFHGYDITICTPERRLGQLHLRFMRNKKRLADDGTLFIAVSDFIKNKLIDAGFPEHKIIRHYIGINTRFFCPDSNIERKPRVLQVARLVPYKGQHLLIQAMAKVAKSFPGVELVLIGDGPERINLERLSEKLNVNTHFTGKLSPQQVLQHMREAKVYTQTSIKLSNGHEEALALSIAEAQAVGTPAVVFNSGGMGEAINPNETGFLVQEGDVNGLAESLLSLLTQQELWNRFSVAAVKFIRQNHDLENQCRVLEGIYQSVIDNRRLQES